MQRIVVSLSPSPSLLVFQVDRAEYGILGNRSPTECTVHRLLFVIIPTMHIWQVFAFVFAIFKSIQYFLTTLCGFCHFVLLLSPPRFIGTKHFPSLPCYLLGAVWQVWRIHVEMSAASRHTHTHAHTKLHTT